MNGNPPHLKDGDLLRFLDGEGAPEERLRWQRHLQICARCSAELESVRALARGLNRHLEGIGIPEGFLDRTAPSGGIGARPPARRGESVGGAYRPGPLLGWLRIAALFLLFLLPVALVQPLRAWVVERVSEMFAGEPPVSRAGAPPPPAETPSAPTAIRFTPADGELMVELAHHQAVGVLELSRTTASTASLTFNETEAGGGAIVTERFLRIQNRPDATASYRLAVPAGVTHVLVAVAGDPPRLVLSEQLDVAVELDLGSDPRSPGS